MCIQIIECYLLQSYFLPAFFSPAYKRRSFDFGSKYQPSVSVVQHIFYQQDKDLFFKGKRKGWGVGGQNKREMKNKVFWHCLAEQQTFQLTTPLPGIALQTQLPIAQQYQNYRSVVFVHELATIASHQIKYLLKK